MAKRLYLTKPEVQQLIEATYNGRYGVRDRCMICIAYIHGLRVSELTGLKMSDLDLEGKRIHIRRLKNGFSTVHPILAEEIELLNDWLKIRHNFVKEESTWLFLTSQGKRLSRQRLSMLLKRYSVMAALNITVNPHMLRHGCGYELAEQGLDTRLIQDYLGHR
ncbi:tyrosine-type recombinase/integrase, partial [Enterobacter sp.]|uniref:tyrosine-type recombinase/integrase n=1 Tax=Enterobacter sp. TaxID=42895 RepID=UPI003D122415